MIQEQCANRPFTSHRSDLQEPQIKSQRWAGAALDYASGLALKQAGDYPSRQRQQKQLSSETSFSNQRIREEIIARGRQSVPPLSYPIHAEKIAEMSEQYGAAAKMQAQITKPLTMAQTSKFKKTKHRKDNSVALSTNSESTLE